MKLSIRIENYVATINFYQIRNNMKNTILFLSLSLLVNLNAKAIDTNFSKQIPLEEQRVMMLSDNDIKILKHMREEEKLARDVYDYLYIKYELPIFDNISNAEQMHMDRVLTLLTKNGIKDPASSKAGIFNNIQLQQLYYELIAQGEKSVVDALKVGATIEDVDIYDLMKFSKETTHPAIKNIFANLTCGSRNHMRAFVNLLEKHDTTYTPQYISDKVYKKILKGKNEKCSFKNTSGMGNQKGKGSGQGKGKGQGSGMGKGRGMGGSQF